MGLIPCHQNYKSFYLDAILLTNILAIGAIVNAAIIATGKAKRKELKCLSKKPSFIPVLTAVTTPLIIMLIPRAIININNV